MNRSRPRIGPSARAAISAGGSLAGEHPMFGEEGRQRLACTEEPRFLYHVLHCEECRDLALAQVADWLPAVAKARPRMVRDTSEAEGLLAELMQLSAEERSEALKRQELHSLPLLDLILESGEEAAQLQDLRGADDLAWLGIELASFVRAEDVWLFSRLSRAHCLAGSARRLGGDLKGADSAFDNASLFLTGRLERGLYCRDLALLRWDQARTEDAAGQLRRAAELLGSRGRLDEEAVCLALLGLLYFEQGLFDSALGPLQRAWQHLLVGPGTWIASRGLLSLGVCLAAHGQASEAWEMVGSARSICFSGDSEKAVTEWLEGKVESYVGDSGKAREQLDSALQKLLAEHRLIEAGLVALDLAALWEVANEPLEIKALVDRLKKAANGVGPGMTAVEVLEQFDHMAAPPRARAALLGAHLLQLARLRRLGAPPIPWV